MRSKSVVKVMEESSSPHTPNPEGHCGGSVHWHCVTLVFPVNSFKGHFSFSVEWFPQGYVMFLFWYLEHRRPFLWAGVVDMKSGSPNQIFAHVMLRCLCE